MNFELPTDFILRHGDSILTFYMGTMFLIVGLLLLLSPSRVTFLDLTLTVREFVFSALWYWVALGGFLVGYEILGMPANEVIRTGFRIAISISLTLLAVALIREIKVWRNKK